MADISTVGTMVSAALALAADEALKTAVGEAVKDTYKSLKELVVRWAPHEMEFLEKSPSSLSHQFAIAAAIDHQSPVDQETARTLAKALLSEIRRNPTIGLELGRLEALEVALGSISVTGGVGVRMKDVRVGGTFRIDSINVGSSKKNEIE